MLGKKKAVLNNTNFLKFISYDTPLDMYIYIYINLKFENLKRTARREEVNEEKRGRSQKTG